MSLIARNNDKEGYQICPAGTHQAVCIAVYDLGMQEKVFNGESKVMHRCIISFEIDERIKGGEYDGKRFVISKEYTVSLGSKSNLRKDLESWRGARFTAQELEGYELMKVVGANALLSIVHTKSGDRTYANIEAISPLVKNMVKLTIETDTTNIPEWVKKKMDARINRMNEKHPENVSKETMSVAEQFDGSIDGSISGEDIPF